MQRRFHRVSRYEQILLQSLPQVVKLGRSHISLWDRLCNNIKSFCDFISNVYIYTHTCRYALMASNAPRKSSPILFHRTIKLQTLNGMYYYCIALGFYLVNRKLLQLMECTIIVLFITCKRFSIN